MFVVTLLITFAHTARTHLRRTYRDVDSKEKGDETRILKLLSAAKNSCESLLAQLQSVRLMDAWNVHVKASVTSSAASATVAKGKRKAADDGIAEEGAGGAEEVEEEDGEGGAGVKGGGKPKKKAKVYASDGDVIRERQAALAAARQASEQRASDAAAAATDEREVMRGVAVALKSFGSPPALAAAVVVESPVVKIQRLVVEKEIAVAKSDELKRIMTAAFRMVKARNSEVLEAVIAQLESDMIDLTVDDIVDMLSPQ